LEQAGSREEGRITSGEDREWVKTWALRTEVEKDVFCGEAICVGGGVKAWKIFLLNYMTVYVWRMNYVCLEKMNELLSKNWNCKNKVELVKESMKSWKMMN